MIGTRASHAGVPDRTMAAAAALVAAGALLSGPIGLAVAAAVPQPPWRDAETWAANFHPLQAAPFWLGFILLGASVFFVAHAAARAVQRNRTRARAALVCAGGFAGIIGVNYALQVAFVPHLARRHDPALAYLVFANPGAASWALEMFGYALLGAATWLVAPIFHAGPHGRKIAGLLVANGVVSVAGAVATGVDLTWVQSAPGLVCFSAWNALLIGTMGFIAWVYRPRARAA
jgi:hypothetical protein